MIDLPRHIYWIASLVVLYVLPLSGCVHPPDSLLIKPQVKMEENDFMGFRNKSSLEPRSSLLPGEPTSAGKENSSVFIGHSTVLVQLDGQNFLTDPIYRERLYILKRHQPPGIPLQSLPVLNFILISHGHLDHMDLETLSSFPPNTSVVIPKKLEGYMHDLGFQDVRALSWGEHTSVGSLVIYALPVKHYSGRSLYETQSIPQSYLVQGTKNIFFCGDSGLTPVFQDIGKTFSIALALLPIGCYKPKSFRSIHMGPEDALEAMRMLGAKRMIPIHWGAFRLSLEPVEDPPKRFLRLLAEQKINPYAVLLQPGEKISF